MVTLQLNTLKSETLLYKKKRRKCSKLMDPWTIPTMQQRVGAEPVQCRPDRLWDCWQMFRQHWEPVDLKSCTLEINVAGMKVVWVLWEHIQCTPPAQKSFRFNTLNVSSMMFSFEDHAFAIVNPLEVCSPVMLYPVQPCRHPSSRNTVQSLICPVDLLMRIHESQQY